MISAGGEMADIIKFKKPKLKDKHKGKTLCRHGFHKWVVCKQKPFDVKTGRLVSMYECSRCGATKTEAR